MVVGVGVAAREGQTNTIHSGSRHTQQQHLVFFIFCSAGQNWKHFFGGKEGAGGQSRGKREGSFFFSHLHDSLRGGSLRTFSVCAPSSSHTSLSPPPSHQASMVFAPRGRGRGECLLRGACVGAAPAHKRLFGPSHASQNQNAGAGAPPPPCAGSLHRSLSRLEAHAADYGRRGPRQGRGDAPHPTPSASRRGGPAARPRMRPPPRASHPLSSLFPHLTHQPFLPPSNHSRLPRWARRLWRLRPRRLWRPRRRRLQVRLPRRPRRLW